jgi:hypothetical protein
MSKELPDLLSFLKDSDLPSEGVNAPDMKRIPELKEKKYLVRRMTTEMYVCTDLENKTYFTKTFENLSVMGEMDEEKVKEYLAKKSIRKGK